MYSDRGQATTQHCFKARLAEHPAVRLLPHNRGDRAENGLEPLCVVENTGVRCDDTAHVADDIDEHRTAQECVIARLRQRIDNREQRPL